MKTYTKDELDLVLTLNSKWIRGEPDGIKANLSKANLSGANLTGADLSRADLSGANLNWANLSGANLTGAELSGAELSGANLSRAYLSGAELSVANLSGANLTGANLRGANLRGANLSRADLSGANLYGANLRGANLSGAKNLSALAASLLSIVPQTGDFEAYKKLSNRTVAKLLIPAGAKRSNATGRKCRAEYAIVLIGDGYSIHDSGFRYEVGKTVRCHKWEEDRFIECGGGIHFFITREEAEAYE